MKLLMFELDKNKRVFIIGSILISILLILSLSFYPLYYKHLNYFKELFNTLPPKTLESMSIEISSLDSIITYYAFFFKLYSIFLAFFSLVMGIKMLSDDKKDKRANFYFKKPMKRNNILLIKVSSNIIWLFVNIIIVQIVSSIFIFILKKQSISYLELTQINFSLFLLELVFYFIGLVVGNFTKSSHQIIIPLSIIIIFELISYVTSSFNLTLLEYINPFSYFKVGDIIEQGRFQYRFLVITVVIVFFLYQFINGIYENEEIGGDSFD